MIRAVVAAALSLSLAVLAFGSTLRELDGQAGTGGAAPTNTPAPTAARPTGSPEPGWTRIHDDRGGWSIDMPAAWFHHDMTGGTGTAGHAIASYDTRTHYPPPDDGALLSVQLLWDRSGDATTLQTFAERRVWIATCAPCREILDSRELTLGGQRVESYLVKQNQPLPLERLEPRRYWLLRSPFFAERILVITATPGVSPLSPTVERIVSTLNVYRPAPPDLTPTKTRQQVIAEFRGATPPTTPLPGWSGGTITRIEAKLMRYADWETAYNAMLRARAASGGGPTAVYGNNDPDVMVWVVAMTGSFLTPQKGPPRVPGFTSPSPPAPWGWRLLVVPAREPYSWACPCTGGPEAVWPAWFDHLTDRDR